MISAIRRVIAEFTGRKWYWHWRNSGVKTACLGFPPEEGLEFPGTKGTVSQTQCMTSEEVEQAMRTGEFESYMVPCYTQSLDAMQEAESKLTHDQSIEYQVHLRTLTRAAADHGTHFSPYIVHAKACHRASAFVRTVTGDWLMEVPEA